MPMGRNNQWKPLSQSIRSPTPPHTRIPARRVPVTAHAVEKPVHGVPLWGGRDMGRAIIGTGRKGGRGRDALHEASDRPSELVEVFTSRTIQSGATVPQPFPRGDGAPAPRPR